MAERIRLEDRECPLSATLRLVGEWWTLLILHDAFGGYTRFDQFRDSLGISSSLLTSRLKRLVDVGLLERPYAMRHPSDWPCPHGGMTLRSPLRPMTFDEVRADSLSAVTNGTQGRTDDHPHIRRGW